LHYQTGTSQQHIRENLFHRDNNRILSWDVRSWCSTIRDSTIRTSGNEFRQSQWLRYNHILYLQSHPRAVVKPKKSKNQSLQECVNASSDCLRVLKTDEILVILLPFRILPRLPTLSRIRFDAPSQKIPRSVRTQGHRFPKYLSIITRCSPRKGPVSLDCTMRELTDGHLRLNHCFRPVPADPMTEISVRVDNNSQGSGPYCGKDKDS